MTCLLVQDCGPQFADNRGVESERLIGEAVEQTVLGDDLIPVRPVVPEA